MFPQSPTKVQSDLVGFRRWVRELPDIDRTYVLVDSAVVDSEIDCRISESIQRHATTVRRSVVGPAVSTADVVAAAEDVPDGTLVIGVGGGRTMDRAKLLSLFAGGAGVQRRLTTSQRCGMVLAPAGVSRRVPLALVPTTLGTGAELSRTACFESAGRKRLILGEALRADCAVHVPEATDGLPDELVAEGILEALLRLTACYAGSLGELPRQDELVHGYAIELLRLGEQVRIARAVQVPIARQVRAAAARISGASHTEDVINRRDPFCDISWPLANELSMATGSRKLQAIAALLPVVWRRIAAGDQRLGSAPRLTRLWKFLRGAAAMELGPDPANGLTTLITHWGIQWEGAADISDADSLAALAAQAWGRGLPMLKGLSVPQISSIYLDAADLATEHRSVSSNERRKSNV